MLHIHGHPSEEVQPIPKILDLPITHRLAFWSEKSTARLDRDPAGTA
jgi:hypothetical protein